MAFENLYHLSDQEIKELYKEIYPYYYDDSLFMSLFPNDKKRKKVSVQMCRLYIRAIYPFSHFLASDADKHCVLILHNSRLENRNMLRLRFFWMSLRMFFFLFPQYSLKSFVKVIKCMDIITSGWKSDFVNDNNFHIEMLYAKESVWGKKYYEFILNVLCEEAKTLDYDITIEIHKEEKLAFYDSFGFRLMQEITYEEYHAKRYCMLLRNRKEDSYESKA